MHDTHPEAILEFWFGRAPDDPAEARARGALWFGAAPETDRTIRARFVPTIEAAARGELHHWLNDARSALALIVVLDQFPLNAWRGTTKPYEYGGQALDAARHAVAAGYLHRLAPIENAFLILPYQHSEAIEDQRESVRLGAELVRSAPPAWRPLMKDYLGFARQHLAIIERFGRFPHRSRVLGRSPTQAEQEYLAGGGATFGQG
ncbi:MAG: DUF924 family protein [Gammaproteobacteria bacterium]